MGQKEHFFQEFFIAFTHLYLVFHKMYFLHLFGKFSCNKNQEINKICDFLAKKVIFGTKKGVNESKNIFFSKFFFLVYRYVKSFHLNL